MAEMSLAHAVGTQVERSYQRSDLFAKRRQVAERWARFCMTSAAGGGDNVRAIRG